MDAFIRGDHSYVVPTESPRESWGFGPGGVAWPSNVTEIAVSSIGAADVDVIVLQRLEELELAAPLLRAGVPAVFVEHNAPRVDVPSTLHPLRDRDDITIAHVTHLNQLFWITGSTPTRVIEHGVVDPGPRYSGQLERFGVVVNEPVRRMRVSGTDLLPPFAAVAPIDHFGMHGEGLHQAIGLDADALTLVGDVPADAMHTALAERRAYLHLNRWTSLGLSLIEAMHMAMPVLVLAATDAPRAVPPEAGAISSNVEDLVRAARLLIEDPAEASRRGRTAREAALARYSLGRFQADWDELLDDVTGRRTGALVATGRTIA
jgi:hypothetical protein